MDELWGDPKKSQSLRKSGRFFLSILFPKVYAWKRVSIPS